MHYIRFLKTPKVHVEHHKVSLKAVITVTTDLGETYFQDDLDLVATIRASAKDGEVYLRRNLQWPARARSLPVSFDLTRNDIEWPACLHIAPRTTTANAPGFLLPIIDVWSGLLDATKGQFDSGHRVERRFVSLAERTVTLLEDSGDSIARHLWDGSQALAQFIDQTVSMQCTSSMPLLEYVLVSATYRRLNITELGCGCGTVGISLAQVIPDCDILLTDLPEVSDLVEANISRLNPAINSKVSFEPLDWEQPLSSRLQSRPSDLVLVSECTYNTDTLQPLVNTISALVAQSPKAIVVVSTKTRHHSESAFFDMMKVAGFIQESNIRVPLPGQPGDGYADWATDVGLYLFHGQNHRLSLSPRDSEQEVRRAQTNRARPDGFNSKEVSNGRSKLDLN